VPGDLLGCLKIHIKCIFNGDTQTMFGARGRCRPFARAIVRFTPSWRAIEMTSNRSTSLSAPLCSEEEITQLVHAFYARVRQDEQLGPIFNAHVDDWDHHLAKLVDFWSSILLRTGRYSGTPMPKHAALPGLNADLFHRWLALFRQTANEQPNRAMAERACTMAERIAQSLWMGYQMVRCPDTIASPLPYA
jgi:Truncated hemoglobins